MKLHYSTNDRTFCLSKSNSMPAYTSPKRFAPLQTVLCHVCFLLFVLTPTFLIAQEKLDYIYEGEISRMAVELRLTEAQLQEINILESATQEKLKNYFASRRYSQEAFDALYNEKFSKLKGILEPSQLETLLAINEERRMEAEGAQVSSSLRRYNEQYPGMNMNTQQMLLLNDKTKKLLKQVKELNYQEVKVRMNQAWKEVLTAEQFAIYQAHRVEERNNAQTQGGESIQAFLPLMEELLSLYSGEFLPVLRSIRTKLDTYISSVDRSRLEQIKSAYQTAFLEKVEWDFLSSEIDFGDQETETRFKQFYDEFIHFGLSYTIDVKSLDRFIGKESFDLAKKLGQYYSVYINVYKKEIEQRIKGLEDQEQQIIKKYIGQSDGIVWDNGFSSNLDINHIIRILLLEPNTKEGVNIVTVNQLHQAKAFPSPAVNSQTLDFEMQQEGEVLIEIIDAQGRVVKTLFKGERSQGANTLNVDISQLKGQSFFYRITNNSGISTLKILLAK